MSRRAADPRTQIEARRAAAEIEAADFTRQATMRRVAVEEGRLANERARAADERATHRIERAEKLNTIALGHARLVLLALTRLGQLLHNTVWAFLSGFLRITYTKLAPYLVLALIVALALGVGFSSRSYQKARTHNSLKPVPWYARWWLDTKAFFASFGVSPGARRALGALSPGAEPEAVPLPRRAIAGGRCDDTDWREIGPEGEDGLCARTMAPGDILWTLDADRMELDELPTPELRERVTGRDGERMQVRIPQRLQGSFFVPQCGEAAFRDGAPAADLLRDDGLACERVRRESRPYARTFRPRGAERLDDFVRGGERAQVCAK